MVQIGYNSTAPNPQQLLAQNNSAPVVPETMQSTEPMMSVDPSMVKPDSVVAKKPTNQFDYAANIGAIPGVNTYSPAENPIFKTQIFKDSIAKQRAIPDAIKDFTSGMPKEEFANYYKEFKAEDAEWISKLSEDLKGGIPYSKIREFYPEIDEYGLKNLEKTIKSDEYLSDLRLDGETQLLSNEMKGLDPTIDYLGPIFEGNAKENLSEYGFGGTVIEGGKLIANIVPAAINSLLLFPINAITQPVNTVKMLGKLPKAAKLGFKQAWDDTEGMSDAERVRTMVSLGMDFITENPDIIFAPEALLAKGGLASKGASLARRVVSNVGERGQKFINAAGNVQDTLKWEDKVIQGAKQGFEAAFEKEKKAPSNVSQETKDLLYTALPPRAKNLKYMTAVEYKESIPEALKSLFTNRDNLQVMPDPDTGAIKGLFQGDKIAKMNDTELVKNIVGAADTTLKDTWDIILEVGDQAAADGILGNTKDIVANIDNVLDNMQIGNTKILNTDTKTIRMLGEFRNQLLQNGGNIDIKTLQSLSQRLNKFWKEGDPMMIAAAEEINKLLRPLITDVGMQVLDNLNLSSIKKQWGGLRNLTDNFEALSKYAEKYPSPNVFQKANDLWSKIQAVKGAARILSGDPSGALDLGAAVMQNMGGAQLKGFDRIKGFAKGFRNMADHVGDTKIPGGYGRGYVKNLIKARINNTPKLGYTPEATPMMTPEGTINQTIVTAPEKKGGYMQTDITKPGAIKQPLQSNNINGGNRGNEGGRGDGGMNGGVGNDGTAGGAIGEAIPVMKEIAGAESNVAKGNGQDGLNDGKSKAIEDYANKNIIKEPSSDVSTTKEVPKSKPTLQDIRERMKNATPEEIDANLKELRTFREQLVKKGDSSSKELIKEVDDDIAYITELKKSPKDLQPLYEEARKYKSAEEFVNKYSQDESFDTAFGKKQQQVLKEDNNLYYHGTTNTIDGNLSVSKSSSIHKEGGIKAVYLTKDKSWATNYTKNNPSKLALVKVDDIKVFNDWDGLLKDADEGKVFRKATDGGDSTYWLEEQINARSPGILETKEFVDYIKSKGYNAFPLLEEGRTGIALLDDSAKVISQSENPLKQIREEAQSTVKSTDESLMEEASKYKSAEEFVKAQGKPVYHGTNKKLDKLTTGNNRNVSKSSIMGKSNYVFVTDNKDTAAIFANNRYEFLGGEKNIYQAYIDGDAKILDFGKTNDTYKSTLESLGYERPIEVEGGDITNLIETPEFVKRLNDAGYSGVSVYEKGGKTIAILDDNLVKTESQLKQIREEANSEGLKATVKAPEEALIVEARKYKSAEEFVSDPTIQKKLLDSTKNFKSEYPELPKVKEPEIIQKKIDEYKADYEHYKSKGQDTFAKNAKEYMEEFEAKLEQSKKEWGDFYKNRKIYTDKYGNLSQGEYQLKQIREEANQSRRKDLPTRKDAVRAKNQENMDKYGTNNPEPIDILTYDKNILQKQFNNLINAGDTVSAGKILPELTELIDKVNEIVKAKARQKILDRKKTNPNLPSPPNQ